MFDTNVYRGLSRDAFEEIRRLERSRSVLGMANFRVAIELLAHLASETDPDFRHAWAALRKLATHCSEYDGSRYITRFIPDANETLSLFLFGSELPNRKDHAMAFGRLIGEVAAATVPADWAVFQPSIVEIRDSLAADEGRFVRSIWESLILPLVPDATGWDALSRRTDLRNRLADELASPAALHVGAVVMVQNTAARLGLAVDEPTVDSLAKRVLTLFPTPLRFYSAVIRHIVVSGYKLDKPSHANALWDAQILYSTTKEAELEGTPVWLVTNESLVISAAAEAGADDVIMSVESYLAELRDL